MRIKDVRVLLVGVGHWGFNHYKTLAALTNNFKVYDTNPSRTFTMNGVSNMHVVGTNEANYDAVIIATESVKHFELTKYYWERGCSVLCEKPVVKSKEELDELVHMVKQRPDQVFMAGHTLMYHPAILDAVDWAVNCTDINVVLRRMKYNPIKGEDEIYRLAPHDISILDRLGILDSCDRCGNSLYFSSDRGKANVVVSWSQDPPIRDLYILSNFDTLYFNDYQETYMIEDRVVWYDKTPPLMKEQIAFLSSVAGRDMNHSDIYHTERVYTALTHLKKWEPL